MYTAVLETVGHVGDYTAVLETVGHTAVLEIVGDVHSCS